MDKPRRLKDGRIVAHLLSDRHGKRGENELVAIATVIGCHPYALQHAGTYKEHFDLIGPRRIRAAERHPLIRQVGWREISAILKAKRRE